MPITDIDRLVIYSRSDDRELIPLSSPTTDVGANSTTIATGISIGFTFRFDGVSYTTLALSPRGYLRFAGTVDSADNTLLFAASTNIVIAPWWDALETKTSGGYIKHETQGVAPWRRFVAEWYVNLSDTYDATNYRAAKMQVVLYESSDRYESRYGSLETGGSPGAAGSASIGVKGNTSVTVDNFRDYAVTNIALGASKTTTTANLAAPASWPATTHVAEPNWPMVGFFIDIADDDLTGLQDRYADVIWSLCNNVNWLYCKHTPSLVNLAPTMGAALNNPIIALPVQPNIDDLTYRCWIEVHTTVGGDITVTVDRDNAADPQPSTALDWTTLATSTMSGTSIGEVSFTSFTVASAAVADYLRFAFTGNGLTIMSITMAPDPLTDFDPTATFNCGFVPMGIGQFRQRGGAIHPEILNRAYRNVARITGDRHQMLWSFCTPDHNDYSYSGATATPQRRFGFAPTAIPGFVAQSATAWVYALDTTDGGKLEIAEEGGSVVSFTVDLNGTEYRMQTGTLALLLDQPTVIATADPAGSMRPRFVGLTWVPPFTNEDMIASVTPAPKLDYLFNLRARLAQACRAYAMTGLAARMERDTSNARWVSWMVPPATKALRARVGRLDVGDEGAKVDTTIYAASSGSAVTQDRIDIPGTDSDGGGTLPELGTLGIISTANLYETSPAAASNRLLESPTLGTATGAVRELVKIMTGYGATIVPISDRSAVG